MKTLYKNARILNTNGFTLGDFCVEDGLIAEPAAAQNTVDLNGAIVAPGYVDVHIHGAFGVDCIDGNGAVAKMAAGLPQFGVTGFFPALLTAPAAQMKAAFDEAAALYAGKPVGAKVMGIHNEGPFFNLKKAGAQPKEDIKDPDMATLDEIIGSCPKALRKLSIAPELPGALEMIRACTARGIVASVGHTEATYDQTLAAFEAGARQLTHLYNAMPPLHHRNPGPIAAGLLDDRISVELIADGVHIHPAMLMMAVGLAGDRCILITDAMMAAGMGEGDSFTLGPNQVFVRDNAARLADGTLAGSVLTMDRAVRNMAGWGVPLHKAIGMAAVSPRVAFNLPTQAVAPGQPADLVILDDQAVVKATLVDGQTVYQA